MVSHRTSIVSIAAFGILATMSFATPPRWEEEGWVIRPLPLVVVEGTHSYALDNNGLSRDISPDGLAMCGSGEYVTDFRGFRTLIPVFGPFNDVDILAGLTTFPGPSEAYSTTADLVTVGYLTLTGLPDQGDSPRRWGPGGGDGSPLEDSDGDFENGRAITVVECQDLDAGCGSVPAALTDDLQRAGGYVWSGPNQTGDRVAAIWGPPLFEVSTPSSPADAEIMEGTSTAVESEVTCQSTYAQVAGYLDDAAVLWTQTTDSIHCGGGGWDYDVLPVDSGYLARPLGISENNTLVNDPTDALVVGYEESASSGLQRAVAWHYDASIPGWVKTVCIPDTTSLSSKALAVDTAGNILVKSSHNETVGGSAVIVDRYYLYDAGASVYRQFDTSNVSGIPTGYMLELVDFSEVLACNSYGPRFVGQIRKEGEPTKALPVVLESELDYISTCLGDFDSDDDVDFQDLVALLALWDSTEPGPDLDCSGIVDYGDLLLLLAKWGECDGTGSAVPPDVLDCMNASSNPSRQLDCLEALIETTGAGAGE